MQTQKNNNNFSMTIKEIKNPLDKVLLQSQPTFVEHLMHYTFLHRSFARF